MCSNKKKYILIIHFLNYLFSIQSSGAPPLASLWTSRHWLSNWRDRKWEKSRESEDRQSSDFIRVYVCIHNTIYIQYSQLAKIFYNLTRRCFFNLLGEDKYHNYSPRATYMGCVKEKKSEKLGQEYVCRMNIMDEWLSCTLSCASKCICIA